MTKKVVAKGKRGKGKAGKAKRLELTTRQRDLLKEDATSPLTRQEVAENGKLVTPDAAFMADLKTLASRDGDPIRQRVYAGLLKRARLEFGRKSRKPQAAETADVVSEGSAR